MTFIKQNGIWQPKPKSKPEQRKDERPKTWDCPGCGYYYDSEKEGPCEEATVGSLNPKRIPHIICPNCKKCMGCAVW